MKRIFLRQASLEDAKAISNIYLASRKKFVSFAPLAHSDESIHKWVIETLIPAGQVIVAEKDAIIVGMLALSKSKDIGWIDQLYLSPEVVGQGIGSLLVEAAKTKLGSPIRLHVFQENVKARRFYEKHGFQIVKLTDGSQNEENCPDVLYEWKV
jgi:ribosomal protein S18 acetylase RimI-like enzyme